jgi:hypothetical protein
METLVYSMEERVRGRVRREYQEHLQELRRAVIEQQAQELLEFRRAMEEEFGKRFKELAAHRHCGSWCGISL